MFKQAIGPDGPQRKSWKRALTATVLGAASIAAQALPTTFGNLLVSDVSTGVLREYTPQGQLVQSWQVPSPDRNFSDLRDIVQSADGRIHMFNGTFTPWMTSLSPSDGSMSHLSMDGWSTVNNISYGGIATLGQYVYVTDMYTYGGEAEGVVRFDLSNGSARRFDVAGSPDDLTLGLDGLLYVGGSVYDPISMSLLRRVTLQGMNGSDIRGRAVDANGFIYTADWGGRISKFRPDGRLVSSLNTGNSLMDIDVDASGRIVAGSRFGGVYMTDTNLSNLQSFFLDNQLLSLHVAFTNSNVPEPASLALAIAGLAAALAVRRRRLAMP